MALVLAWTLTAPLTVAGQSSAIFSLLFYSTQNSKVSTDGIWAFVDQKVVPNNSNEGSISPRLSRTSHLNQTGLTKLLAHAPKEFSKTADITPVVLTLPMADGQFARFRIVESSIMEPALALRFPEIRTYRGQGLDDPSVTTRFDWTPLGFHAIVLANHSTMVVEPADAERGDYVSYYSQDLPSESAVLNCLTADADHAPPDSPKPQLQSAAQTTAAILPNGSTLRTFRVAIGVTGEYTQIYGGGTVSGGLAAVITAINNFDAFFEREVAVRLVVVANQTSIIYTSGATDGYTHANQFQMGNENQAKLDSIIGSGNYDIGHVFDGQTISNGYGASGAVSFVGGVGVNGQKAKGATLFYSLPPSHPYHTHALAHELGHQFGATHSFNGTTSPCGPERIPSTAYEPGSGSTIMGYGGLCGAEAIPTQETYYHEGSLEQIVALTTSGPASAIAVLTPTGNTPPVVQAGDSFTIPANTPFTLTAMGSDPDGDALTFCWEEFDLGTPSPPNTDDGSRPLFRSFFPTTKSSRTFPQLSDILSGTSTFGESLPSTTRTMKFRVTVRDNRAGGGGINFAQTLVNVRSGFGPFNVTQPTASSQWLAGSMQTVTWNVAGTSSSPINCNSVRILLSIDGGNTFPFTLAGDAPNTGVATVRVPNAVSSFARVKVESVGNVFFNISLPNFTITSNPQIQSANIISAASFDPALIAPESIAVILGSNLATGSMQAPSNQLPTELLGTKVWVNGVQASLFFVSSGQINFLVPPGIGPGNAVIDVLSGDGTLSSDQVMIALAAPGLFTANALGTGAPLAEVTTDGLRYSPVGNSDGSANSIHNGDYLTLYGTGIRQTGAGSVVISIGGVNAPVFHAAAEPDLPGLDQVETRIPNGVTGDVDLVLSINGKTANVVRLRIN